VKGVDHQVTGHVAGIVTAHPISDDEQTQFVVDTKGIFIGFSPLTDVSDAR
jgi:hypothetical protein